MTMHMKWDAASVLCFVSEATRRDVLRNETASTCAAAQSTPMGAMF